MKKIFIFFMAIIFAGSSVIHAQTIYANTSSTVFYTNATVSVKTGQPIIYLDDVNIPSSVMGGIDSLDVTGITLAFGKNGRQIPLWVDFYYSQVNSNATTQSDLCNFPPVHFDSLYAYGRGMFGNLYKTFGDSVHTVFRVKTTKDALKKGYNTFFTGMSFSIASDITSYTHGPLFTTGGTAQNSNSPLTWYYDGVKGGKVNKVTGQPGAFYLVLWGKPTGSNMLPVPLVTGISNAANGNVKTTGAQCNIYPNPATTSAALQLQLAKASKVSVQVFSSAGILVNTSDKGLLPQGTSMITLNLSKLAQGIYHVKIIAGETIINKIISKL